MNLAMSCLGTREPALHVGIIERADYRSGLKALSSQPVAGAVKLGHCHSPRSFDFRRCKLNFQVCHVDGNSPGSLDVQYLPHHPRRRRMNRHQASKTSRNGFAHLRLGDRILHPLNGRALAVKIGDRLQVGVRVNRNEQYCFRKTNSFFTQYRQPFISLFSRNLQGKRALMPRGPQCDPYRQQRCAACKPVCHRSQIPRSTQCQIGSRHPRGRHNGHRKPESRPFTRHTAKLALHLRLEKSR